MRASVYRMRLGGADGARRTKSRHAEERAKGFWQIVARPKRGPGIDAANQIGWPKRPSDLGFLQSGPNGI